MAELEAELGVQATYLLMTESVFYNLASSEGVAAIARLRELGHAVGLHAVHPNVVLDERFDPVVSWHNPKPEFLSDEIPGAANAYGEALFRDRYLPLGLEPALAVRLSPRGAARGHVPVAPDPRPSGDLGLSGRDHGTDDAGDARGRPRTPARSARRRRRRPDVRTRASVSDTPPDAAATYMSNAGLSSTGEREAPSHRGAGSLTPDLLRDFHGFVTKLP